MSEQKIQGKKGVFSINPDQAMDWLTRNKNVFTVLSYIILRKNFRRNYLNDDLELDEVYVTFRDLKIQPKLTVSQWRRSLDNLCYYGFIEILEYKPVVMVAKMKKIKILVDIFDPKISRHVKDYINRHGGSCFL